MGLRRAYGLFFLVVILEMKKEIASGEFSLLSRVALPLFGFMNVDVSLAGVHLDMFFPLKNRLVKGRFFYRLR